MDDQRRRFLRRGPTMRRRDGVSSGVVLMAGFIGQKMTPTYLWESICMGTDLSYIWDYTTNPTTMDVFRGFRLHKGFQCQRSTMIWPSLLAMCVVRRPVAGAIVSRMFAEKHVRQERTKQKSVCYERAIQWRPSHCW